VRQRSMALIPLSWARLTWPALALHHARAGRDMIAGGYAGGSFLFTRSGVRRSNGLMTVRMVLVATCA
jgi:hypothetical protein